MYFSSVYNLQLYYMYTTHYIAANTTKVIIEFILLPNNIY